MLTSTTRQAIAVLHEIAGFGADYNDSIHVDSPELAALLARLEYAGLLHRLPVGEVGSKASYQLCHPFTEISLLDVLVALNEHLNCNNPNTEALYYRNGNAAKKLGVVNHMTRLYLQEIKLSDLQ